MNRIELPEIPMPSEDDWQYYLSFGTPQKYLDEVARGLQEENRYFTDFRFLKLLHWYICSIGNDTLPKGKILYRARLYNSDNDIETKDSVFKGYGKADSFVPPDGKVVSHGRANPDRIVYLYTANSINTAIAEIHPPLKSWVSVAEIEIVETLYILNFDIYSISYTEENTFVKAWQCDLILTLARRFNRHYFDSRDYILCQYISEFVKNIGFDGISFRSSKVLEDRTFKKKDRNYTIFSYQKCEPISSNLFYIANHSYTLQIQDENGCYEMFEES